MDHVRQINLANRRNVDFGLRAIIEIAVKKAISSTPNHCKNGKISLFILALKTVILKLMPLFSFHFSTIKKYFFLHRRFQG